MKNKFLSLIATGLMLGGASQVKAMEVILGVKAVASITSHMRSSRHPQHDAQHPTTGIQNSAQPQVSTQLPQDDSLGAKAVVSIASNMRSEQPQPQTNRQQQIFINVLKPLEKSFGRQCTDGSLIFVRPCNLNAEKLEGQFKVTYTPANVISTTRSIGNIHQPVLKESYIWDSVQKEVTTLSIVDQPEANQSQKDYAHVINKEFTRIIELYEYIVSDRIQCNKDPITGK